MLIRDVFPSVLRKLGYSRVINRDILELEKKGFNSIEDLDDTRINSADIRPQIRIRVKQVLTVLENGKKDVYIGPKGCIVDRAIMTFRGRSGDHSVNHSVMKLENGQLIISGGSFGDLQRELRAKLELLMDRKRELDNRIDEITSIASYFKLDLDMPAIAPISLSEARKRSAEAERQGDHWDLPGPNWMDETDAPPNGGSNP